MSNLIKLVKYLDQVVVHMEDIDVKKMIALGIAEIAELKATLNMRTTTWQHYTGVEKPLDAAMLINQLKAERDEARQELCFLHAGGVSAMFKKKITQEQVARQRNWDCFDNRQPEERGDE